MAQITLEELDDEFNEEEKGEHRHHRRYGTAHHQTYDQ